MEESIFLEIVFKSSDFQFAGRDEIEDPLEEALIQSGVGEVTGGGSGMGFSNIDVEVKDFDIGLKIIRNVLQSLKVSKTTIIKQYKPIKQDLSVY